jgi:signal transduction histidine kinase
LLIEKFNGSHRNIEQENKETQYADLERYFISQPQKEFASIAGHEMKTTIQAILAYSELLQDKHDESREDYIKAILRNAQRLKMLSDNLTDLTKIDADMMKLRKKRFDLGALVLSLVKDFESMNRHNESKIKISVQSVRHVFVNADAQRLAQVILNLLDNAIKFTKDGSISITLEQRPGEDFILATITDTGPGIDSKVKPDLFNKFATSSYSGTGLGLYICRNIIEAHGGRIWAENNSGRNGATFSFTIPANHIRSNLNYTKFLNSTIKV